MSSPFGDQVEVYCTARVGDEELTVRQSLSRPVWEDPEAREAIKENLRFKLVMEILKKWTPVVKVRR